LTINQRTFIIKGDKPGALRGGSWNNNRRNARVSNRNNNHPDNFNNNVGFRVILAPDFYTAGKIVFPRKAIGQKKSARFVPCRGGKYDPPGNIQKRLNLCGRDCSTLRLRHPQPFRSYHDHRQH